MTGCPVDHDAMFNSVPDNPKPYGDIPAEESGIPFLGDSIAYTRDPIGFSRERYKKYGPISRMKLLGQDILLLVGPAANQATLLDRERVFSNKEGWDFPIGHLFPRGLMLRDFDDHRSHRLVMQAAFNKEPMQQYMEMMNPDISGLLDQWIPAGHDGVDIEFYNSIKKLTLDLATTIFVGEELGGYGQKVNKAITDVVVAAGAFLRLRIPGTKFWAGIRGREFLVEYFQSRIEERRAGSGNDMFSQLCRAQAEDGSRYTDDEIVDHMIFLLFAAHDTTTIAFTTMVYYLAKHPEWQERLRQQSLELGKPYVDYEDLGKMSETELVFKEALRLIAPVYALMRRTVKDSVIGGYQVPSGTFVAIQPCYSHVMDDFWNESEGFDPERFTKERSEDKVHKFAYVPFGGGVHKCLGMHFADHQVKAVMHQMLLRYRWSVADGYTMEMDYSSMPKPKDGLKIRLERLSEAKKQAA